MSETTRDGDYMNAESTLEQNHREAVALMARASGVTVEEASASLVAWRRNITRNLGPSERTRDDIRENRMKEVEMSKRKMYWGEVIAALFCSVIFGMSIGSLAVESTWVRAWPLLVAAVFSLLFVLIALIPE